MPTTTSPLHEVYHDVGSYLRSVRESRSIEIEEIARQTRIQPRILRALERNRESLDLKGLYIRSFLEQYASALCADVTNYLQRLPRDDGLSLSESRPDADRLQADAGCAAPASVVPTGRSSKERKPAQTRGGRSGAALTTFLLNALLLGAVLTGFYYINRSEASRGDLPAGQSLAESQSAPGQSLDHGTLGFGLTESSAFHSPAKPVRQNSHSGVLLPSQDVPPEGPAPHRESEPEPLRLEPLPPRAIIVAEE